MSKTMRPKTFLVTGGLGFIGSNFLPYFLEKHKDYKFIYCSYNM